MYFLKSTPNFYSCFIPASFVPRLVRSTRAFRSTGISFGVAVLKNLHNSTHGKICCFLPASPRLLDRTTTRSCTTWARKKQARRDKTASVCKSRTGARSVSAETEFHDANKNKRKSVRIFYRKKIIADHLSINQSYFNAPENSPSDLQLLAYFTNDANAIGFVIDRIVSSIFRKTSLNRISRMVNDSPLASPSATPLAFAAVRPE